MGWSVHGPGTTHAHRAAVAAAVPPTATPACRCRTLLLTAGATSWAIRSKASLLLALVIKRTGPELWEAALPQLLQAAQTEGPPMQEQVGAAAARGLRLVMCVGG